MVEKVPDSTYEMVGGLDKQIREIKEVIELPVKHPELFDALGIEQPKVGPACVLDWYKVKLLLVVGSVTLWPSRNWKNFAGKSCGSSHRVHFHSSIWIRAGPEVHWRRSVASLLIIKLLINFYQPVTVFKPSPSPYLIIFRFSYGS